MDYSLKLKSKEPCDVFLVVKKNHLYAVVVESRTAYIRSLDSKISSDDFVLVCAKHSFAHESLIVTVIDDFALIDGTACTAAELSPAAKEVLMSEVSGC